MTAKGIFYYAHFLFGSDYYTQMRHATQHVSPDFQLKKILVCNLKNQYEISVIIEILPMTIKYIARGTTQDDHLKYLLSKLQSEAYLQELVY